MSLQTNVQVIFRLSDMEYGWTAVTYEAYCIQKSDLEMILQSHVEITKE
jgi:hypothetical protein